MRHLDIALVVWPCGGCVIIPKGALQSSVPDQPRHDQKPDDDKDRQCSDAYIDAVIYDFSV